MTVTALYPVLITSRLDEMRRFYAELLDLETAFDADWFAHLIAKVGNAGQLGAAIVVALITLAVNLGLAGVQRLVTPEGLKRTAHTSAGARRRLSQIPTLRRAQTP